MQFHFVCKIVSGRRSPQLSMSLAMILSLNGCFMHTEEARFENAHEESTHEHSSKVERRTLQKRNTAPTELSTWLY